MFRKVKGSKYGAKRVTVDGIEFASKAESERYKVLKGCVEDGTITGLTLQPRFVLQEKFECRGEKIRPIEYKADFFYVQNNRSVVEDVKGMILPEFKLKLKMWKRLYGDIHVFRIVKGMKEIRTRPQ